MFQVCYTRLASCCAPTHSLHPIQEMYLSSAVSEILKPARSKSPRSQFFSTLTFIWFNSWSNTVIMYVKQCACTATCVCTILPGPESPGVCASMWASSACPQCVVLILIWALSSFRHRRNK